MPILICRDFLKLDRVPCSAGELAMDDDRQVSPRGWLWIHLDAPFDSPHDQVELTVINSVYEDYAGVRALRHP